MFAFVWIIWKERNYRIFNNSYKSCSFLLNSIFFFVVFWTGTMNLPLRELVLFLHNSGQYVDRSTSRGMSTSISSVCAVLSMLMLE